MDSISNINFGDENVTPTVTPPVKFLWKFLSRIWALILGKAQGSLENDCRSLDKTEEESTDNQVLGTGSQDEGVESDDSVSESERNLRELMSGFQEDRVVGQLEHHHVTKCSERQKKPSSKRNKDAGLVAGFPRSTKKKVARGGGGQ